MHSIKVRLPTEILQVTGSVNGIEVPWTRNGDMWTAICSPSEDKTYHVQLKAINCLGAEFDYALELYDGLRLITDRTKQDVDRVNFLRKKWFAGTITSTEMTEWFSDLKGAYNASDLNRVGAAMEYISQRLADAGYGHTLNLKTDWTAADDNRTGALGYYLKTIRQLRSWFVTWPTTPDTPADLQNLTFEEANNIEKILMDLDDLISRMVQAYYYSGEIYAGEV